MTKHKLFSSLYLLMGAVLMHLNAARVNAGRAGDAPIDASAQLNTTSTDEGPIVPPVKRVAPRMPQNEAKQVKTPSATKAEQRPKPNKKSGN